MFHLLLIAEIDDVLFVLKVYLATLKVYVIDIQVVVVKLLVNLLLHHLVLLVFFQSCVNLINLIVDLVLVLEGRNLLQLRLGGIHNLVSFNLFGLLEAEVQVDQCTAYLN